jgi:hypothetical protein
MLLNPDIASRIDAKLDKSGDCWLWTGYVQEDGYVTLKNYGKVVKLHRVAYQLAHGTIPAGIQVDHRCRVRHCANPNHLRLATNKQNMENIGSRKGSSTPYRGVQEHYRKRLQCYVYTAGVAHHGVFYYCGTHATAEAANEAVIAKRNELYTHNTQERET